MKIIAILLIVVILVINVRLGIFRLNWFEEFADMGSLMTQVKSTMLVTLWCFIGIEGAVMLAARAKRQTDVGKASDECGGVLYSLAALCACVDAVLRCDGACATRRS